MTQAAGSAVEVRSRLLGAETPFSFHEDVVLEVVVRNGRTERIEIPHLKESDQVRLRLRQPGGAAREKTTLLPRPGVPPISGTYRLDAGKEATYKLLLQTYLGPIPAGAHEIQIEIASPEVAYTSPWTKFEVLPLHVSLASIQDSAEAGPNEAVLTWVDAAAKPNRLLWRAYALNEDEGVNFTTRLAELPGAIRSAGAPAAPPEAYGDIRWHAFASGNEVTCVTTNEREAAGAHTFKVDQPARVAGPVLIYPDPTTDVTGCSVLLRPDSATGPQALTALEVTSKGSLAATRRHPLRAAPQLVAISHLSPENRWVFWTQKGDGGKDEIRALAWSQSRGFAAEQTLLAAEAPVIGLAARSRAGIVRIAALVYADPASAPASPYAAGAVVILEAPAAESEWKALKPSIRPIFLPEPPKEARLVLADDGTAWVLAKGKDLLWLGGTGIAKPTGVPFGPKAAHPMLYVQWDGTPRIVFLDQAAGWTSLTPEIAP